MKFDKIGYDRANELWKNESTNSLKHKLDAYNDCIDYVNKALAERKALKRETKELQSKGLLKEKITPEFVNVFNKLNPDNCAKTMPLEYGNFPGSYRTVSDWEIAMRKRFEPTEVYNIDYEIKKHRGMIDELNKEQVANLAAFKQLGGVIAEIQKQIKKQNGGK